MEVTGKKTPNNHLNVSWSTDLCREILAHTDMHAKACTHIDICVQPAIISLAIPMNYVMGKCSWAPVDTWSFLARKQPWALCRDIPSTYWLMINWLIASTLQDSCWSLDGGNTAASNTTSCQSVQNEDLEKLLGRSRCLATCRQSSVLRREKPS